MGGQVGSLYPEENTCWPLQLVIVVYVFAKHGAKGVRIADLGIVGQSHYI